MLLKDRDEIDREVHRVADRIVAEYAPVKIVAFGPYARGELHEAMGLGLLVIKETRESFNQRLEAIAPLIKSFLDVQPIIHTPTELEAQLARGNTFLRNVLDRGIVLYER